MSNAPKRAAPTSPPVPNNSGLIGEWDRDIGVDTVHEALYLIRGDEQDALETSYSKEIVMAAPRQGTEREAATRLLDAYVRARVHYDFPVQPYLPGLLSSSELEEIVKAVADELKRNSRVAEEEQRQHEAPIIKMAKELGLGPRPAGHNDSAWMASCPQSRNHWIMISPSHNEFGCGYCRRKGGPEELRAFYNRVRREGVSHDSA